MSIAVSTWGEIFRKTYKPMDRLHKEKIIRKVEAKLSKYFVAVDPETPKTWAEFEARLNKLADFDPENL